MNPQTKQTCLEALRFMIGYAYDEWGDDAEAAIADLEADASELEVVPDGVYGTFDTITISRNGNFIEINSVYGNGSTRSVAMIPLPANWLLMRRTAKPQEDE